MSEIQTRGKHNIELHFVGDGRTFLNYWDFNRGQDVVCEIVDGKLMLSKHDHESNVLPPVEISFQEFVILLTKSINT